MAKTRCVFWRTWTPVLHATVDSAWEFIARPVALDGLCLTYHFVRLANERPFYISGSFDLSWHNSVTLSPHQNITITIMVAWLRTESRALATPISNASNCNSLITFSCYIRIILAEEYLKGCGLISWTIHSRRLSLIFPEYEFADRDRFCPGL